MTLPTSNRGWTYPTEYLDPWYNELFALFEEIDQDVQDIIDGKLGNRQRAVKDYVNCILTPPTEVSGDRYILDFTSGSVHLNWDGASKGDVVTFDGSAWVAETPVEGWIAYVDALDVDYQYTDDGTPAWAAISSAIALADLSDVTSATATAGNLMVADGGAWVGVPVTGAVVVAASGEVTFNATAETTPDTADLVLIYDNTASAYKQMTRGNFLSDVVFVGTDIAMADHSISGIDNLTFTDVNGAIAGIENQNLVDKTATESISGTWTFTTNFPVTPSSAPSGNYEVANKKYVDDALATVDTWAEVLALGNVSGGTNPTISKNDTIDFLGATSGTISLTPVAVAGTNTLSLPAATDTLVGKATTDTLTNKSISFTTNTVSGTAAEFDTACSDDSFAYVSDNLSVFASTTSLQLAGVISDETGSGALVFGTSPALTTPTGIIASDIVISGGFGTPSYDDLADFIDYTGSSGRLTGGVISDGGGGTVDISELEGMIYSGSSLGDPIVFFKRAAEVGLSLAGDGVNYILATYNAGTIDYSASLSRPALETHGQFVLGRVWRSGTDVEIANTGQSIYNQYGRAHDRLIDKYGFLDRASGGVVSAHATPLRLQCSAGNWYTGHTNFTTSAADTFRVWYKSGSATWVESAELTLFSEVFDGGTYTVYNRYQDGNNLTALTNYGVYWLFVGEDSDLYVVLGTDNYANVAAAQAAQIPSSLPPYCVNWAKFVGKVIIGKQGAAFYSVESAFTTPFTLSAAVDHSGLYNLAWSSSGHTGTVSNLAGFSGAGVASYYSLSGTGTVIPTTVSPSFTTPAIGAATGASLALSGDLTLTAGGSILSTANGDIILAPNGSGITAIGSNATSHTLNTSNDLFVAGRIELDGLLYADSDIEQPSTAFHYFGAPGVDGSFRIGRKVSDQSTLVIEERISGSWEEIHEFDGESTPPV